MEEDGRFVAHLRVFDRVIRAGGTELRVACVGNVITAPEGRGRGHAGRLLEAMLAEVPGEGFAYSLLRAYKPDLYERHGWAPIQAELVDATLPPDGAGPLSVEPFVEEDLPKVMRLYDASNAGRSGTTVRSPAYWRAQLEWLNEDRKGFLVTRGSDGTLAGYVRSRAGEEDVEVLELGLRPGEQEVGRALLSAACSRRRGRLRALLPPSLRTLFRPGEAEISNELALMGRVLDLHALVAALEPSWLRRVRESGGREQRSFRLTAEPDDVEVRVSVEEVRLCESVDEEVYALDEGSFAHLLFRGFDPAAEEKLDSGHDLSLLRALFPRKDFVVWRADAF